MTTTTAPRSTLRTGFAGPLILIGLGLLFLLNNLGVLNWNIWEALFRLWPILLIAVGLDIVVGRRSLATSLTITLIVVAVLGVSVWWLNFQGANLTPLAAQSIQQALGGAKRGEVMLSLGVGTLELDAMREPDGLIAGTITTPADKIVRTGSRRGDTMVFQLRYRDGRLRTEPTWNNQDHWKLQLNPEVPISLQLNSGVGTANINLAELQITELRINAGVGQTFVTLPRKGVFTAQIEGGVGHTVVTVPNGVALRINAKQGLGNVTMPQGFEQQGNTFVSPGYEAAANRGDIRINGGVGDIEVREE